MRHGIRRSRGALMKVPTLSKGEKSRSAPPDPKAFRSVDEMLDTGLQLILARREHRTTAQGMRKEKATPREVCARDRAWTQFWHDSLTLTGAKFPLSARFTEQRLTRSEREIVLFLVLSFLGFLGDVEPVCAVVADQLAITPKGKLKILRYLNEDGRLAKAHLADAPDTTVLLPGREVVADPFLIEMALSLNSAPEGAWPARSEDAMYAHFERLATALHKKAQLADDLYDGEAVAPEFHGWEKKVSNLLFGLTKTLDAHPVWALAQVREEFGQYMSTGNNPEWCIFLTLLGRELGHIKHECALFRGRNLVLAGVGSGEKKPRHKLLHLLDSRSFLRSETWVQPCSGRDAFMSDEGEDIADTEFELGPKAVEMLSLTRGVGKRRKARYDVTKPTVRMQDLVLPEKARTSIARATAQARHFNVLFKDWGLGNQITYGRGATLLFHGPPGTGKTAAAQALANELGKQILVADYSQIQNCLVGQTEKNIMRVFNDAREHDAVLFWDEADAMFFNRDASARSWEVRDVNVLLQAIEQFEGVCILATNRTAQLDPALERRISMKVAFERPDREARLEIFRRMVPDTLPLAKDVDLEALAAADLSGGEIKNVLLNAARNALARDGAAGRLCMEDFHEAIREVQESRFSEKHARPIGFAHANGRGVIDAKDKRNTQL